MDIEKNMTVHIKLRQKWKVAWNQTKPRPGWQIASAAPLLWGIDLWKCYLYRRKLQNQNAWVTQVGRLNLEVSVAETVGQVSVRLSCQN